MARTPTADRPHIAQWLIRARETQGWSATAFLRELQAATKAAPNYSTYAQWESGQTTPRESSLAPVIRFWAERGVAGPSAKKEPGPSGDVSGLMAAMTTALLAQAQALTDIRLQLADAARTAEEQREEAAVLLGGLTRELRALQALVGTQAGSAGLG